VGRHQTDEGRSTFLRALREAELERVTTILEDIDDLDLVNLYRAAAVTVLPSLHEGFGFPPLEAMACGCPVVVSNRDSLPEVTGEAALIVDPLDVTSIAQAIERTLCDQKLRESLIASGLRRAAEFSWARTAEAYARLYREVLES
jgi:glycosyltransferase involved in cell wall biosynthesis